MLLHIGNGRSVRGEEIIGIFDLDNATISQESRAYLSAATRAGEVSYSDSDIPRSFLVIAKKNRGAGDDRAQDAPVGRGLAPAEPREAYTAPRRAGDPVTSRRADDPATRENEKTAAGASPRPTKEEKNKNRRRHPMRRGGAKTPPPAQRVLLSHISSAALHARCDKPLLEEE